MISLVRPTRRLTMPDVDVLVLDVRLVGLDASAVVEEDRDGGTLRLRMELRAQPDAEDDSTATQRHRATRARASSAPGARWWGARRSAGGTGGGAAARRRASRLLGVKGLLRRDRSRIALEPRARHGDGFLVRGGSNRSGANRSSAKPYRQHHHRAERHRAGAGPQLGQVLGPHQEASMVMAKIPSSSTSGRSSSRPRGRPSGGAASSGASWRRSAREMSRQRHQQQLGHRHQDAGHEHAAAAQAVRAVLPEVDDAVEDRCRPGGRRSRRCCVTGSRLAGRYRAVAPGSRQRPAAGDGVGLAGHDVTVTASCCAPALPRRDCTRAQPRQRHRLAATAVLRMGRGHASEAGIAVRARANGCRQAWQGARMSWGGGGRTAWYGWCAKAPGGVQSGTGRRSNAR